MIYSILHSTVRFTFYSILTYSTYVFYIQLRSILCLNLCYVLHSMSRGDFQIPNWLPDHKSGLNWSKNVQNRKQ